MTHDDLDKRLSVHEAICAERYAQLLCRLTRLERILLGTAASLLLAFLGVIVSK